jgi:diamine N-acetyltransferase
MKLERVENGAQIAAVAELARETWTRHYTPIIGAAQVAYMLEKFQSAEAIARQIGAEGYEYYWAPGAGYLALVPDAAAKRVLLSKIYVKEELRGAGMGKVLVDFAAARCAELGCRELWLTVNKDNAGSIAFYERLGFCKTNRMTTDIGGGYVMDDWRMAKVLTPAAGGGRG